MRPFLVLFGAALACGGEARSSDGGCGAIQAPDIYVPGQEGRIDGSVWDDGIFATPEAKAEFCAEHGDLPEAWFCRGARQEWCE
jgi:hypothetical protein